jgi:hypothetical protein
LKKATQSKGGNGKLSEEQFVKQAIVNLRKGGYKGIHTRFSGFNDAFRKHFGTDPVVSTRKLAEKGVIEMHPCRGGVMIYLQGEMPEMPAKGDEALAKILAG